MRTNSGLEFGNIAGMKTRLLCSLHVLAFDLRFHTVTAIWTLSIALGLPLPTEKAAAIEPLAIERQGL